MTKNDRGKLKAAFVLFTSALTAGVATAESNNSNEPITIIGKAVSYSSDDGDAIGYKLSKDNESPVILGLNGAGFELLRLSETGNTAMGIVSIEAPPNNKVDIDGINFNGDGNTVIGARFFLDAESDSRRVLSAGVDLGGQPHLAYRFELLSERGDTSIRRSHGLYADGSSNEVTGRWLKEWTTPLGNGQFEYGTSVTGTLSDDFSSSVSGGALYSQSLDEDKKWLAGIGVWAVLGTEDADLTLRTMLLRGFKIGLGETRIYVGPEISHSSNGKTNLSAKFSLPVG